MRTATTWTVADEHRIQALVAPLTMGPRTDTRLSRNNGAMDAYKPKTPNARKGRQQVSKKAFEALRSGQVRVGRISRKRRPSSTVGLMLSGSFRRYRAVRPNVPRISVGT